MNALHQFDLNLLITFEALISECHVSRAAHKVFLSQSAMSHALNRLREQLHDPLLVRTPTGLQPTPRALEMLPKVQEALQLVERTLSPPQVFNPATSDRTFHIACTDYFEAVALPSICQQLQITAPNITLEVEMIGEDASRDRLDNGQVALVVGMEGTQIIPKHMICEHWLTQPMTCLAANDNSQVQNALSIEAFTQLKHVVFADLTSDYSSVIDDWLATQNLSRKHIARTVNYMAAASIVAKTHAIMTLPQEMGKLFSDILPVRLVTPPAGLPASHMTMIYHPLYKMDPGLTWLRQTLHSLNATTVK